jgi:hypothetical protein
VSRRLLVFASALAMAYVPFAACSDAPSHSAEPTSHADVDGASDVRADRSRPQPESAPEYNLDGWVHLDFDPDIHCGFYAAPKDRLPPPIRWEPCTVLADGTGLSCRQVLIDWPPPTGSLAGQPPLGPASSAWIDETGKAWLLIVRLIGDSFHSIVAEADGPVHQAISSTRDGCYLSAGDLRGKRAVWSASRRDLRGSTIYRWGAIGGDVDALPMVLESWADGVPRAYVPGPNTYFALGPEMALRAYAPAPPPEPLARVIVPDPGQMRDFVFVGDEMFFTVGNLLYHRIKVFSADKGARDLISFGNDVSANAADFGTDGKDMVWTEAFGRADLDAPWTTENIMTAPFTSDAASIVKRRLRSEVGPVGARPWVVGCGYAAHDYSSDTETGVRVVRLSDGWSWRLVKWQQDAGPPSTTWSFANVLALTCDEIFINASIHLDGRIDFQVARIRLDSLGPGEPAD